MLKKTEYLCVFLSGSIIYNLIELAWRGYTHWSMSIAGGVCMLSLHVINEKTEGMKKIAKCLIGAGVITAVEFAAGVVVNIFFRLDVWDYSALPGNILGQICPYFTLLWLALTVPAYLLSDLSHKVFTKIAPKVT